MNGKGDLARSNASEDFRNNYDDIDWSQEPKVRLRDNWDKSFVPYTVEVKEND